jgi:hypothetical protein
MELVMPTPASHLPSWGRHPHNHAVYPPLKSMLASIEKLRNLVKSIFINKKSEKVFGKITLGYYEFAICDIQHFH